MSVDTSPHGRVTGLEAVLTYVLLLVGSAVSLIPLLWTLSTSLKTLPQLNAYPPRWIPAPIAWSNYVELFRIQPMLLYLRNSVILVGAAEAGTLVTCAFVAYGFARMRFPGRDVLFVLLVSTMMMPYIVRLIPLFVIYSKIGWINTFLPLTVPVLLGRNPFYIFLLRQFFRQIPNELGDAARIDGCSDVGIWWRIVMPLSGPALAAVAIFAFQGAWDDFLGPMIYMGNASDLRPLAVAMYFFHNELSQTPLIHHMMAMAVLMVLPVVVVFASSQRYFIQGVTMSGLKG